MVSYFSQNTSHFCLFPCHNEVFSCSFFFSSSSSTCFWLKANRAYNELKEYIAEKGGCPIVGCSLLCGHEGNRKSDLCAAVCDSLGLHFYSVCCASLVENTEASTSERICQALERAESSLPCVCCLEGIDALEWSSLQAAEKNRLFTFFSRQINRGVHSVVVVVQLSSLRKCFKNGNKVLKSDC